MSPQSRRLLLTFRAVLIVLAALAALLFLPPIGARATDVYAAVRAGLVSR